MLMKKEKLYAVLMQFDFLFSTKNHTFLQNDNYDVFKTAYQLHMTCTFGFFYCSSKVQNNFIKMTKNRK